MTAPACGAFSLAGTLSAFAIGMLVGAYVLGLLVFMGSRKAHPFTRVGRARMRWFHERDSRAIAYIRAGMHPSGAQQKAEDEMARDARAVEAALD